MVENYFQLLLVILISVVLLSTIHFGFALALIVWVSLFLYMFFRQMKAVKGMSLDAAESDARIWGRIVDYIANIMAVKYHATNNYEQSILRNSQEEYVVSANRRAYYLLKCYFGMGMAFWFYIIGCLIFLIHLHKENAITPGDFAFVFSINYNIIDQLFYSTHTLRDFITNWGSVDNALVTLEEIIPNVRDKKNASVLKVVEGGIEFSNVNFSYNDSDSIFKNKTLKIVPKQRVGLVGYSGSGKSTFINLIVRLYDVQSGSIRIDGHDIRDVTQDSLRSSIAIIPQNPSMFNRSIIDNIRYSSINRTDREVIEAAKKAHAHEFIMKLPGGYNSIVGEGGLKLSGGQRQRLAIAGAILKNASILILDEATSQLDSVTESEIQEALSIVMKDKTTIVVAHRLSTILCMDRILVFDKGIIVEDGTHNELLIKNGLYKSLWDSQVGGLLPEYKL
jgi:ATP-binding cassette subfamily B protein